MKHCVYRFRLPLEAFVYTEELAAIHEAMRIKVCPRSWSMVVSIHSLSTVVWYHFKKTYVCSKKAFVSYIICAIISSRVSGPSRCTSNPCFLLCGYQGGYVEIREDRLTGESWILSFHYTDNEPPRDLLKRLVSCVCKFSHTWTDIRNNKLSVIKH